MNTYKNFLLESGGFNFKKFNNYAKTACDVTSRGNSIRGTYDFGRAMCYADMSGLAKSNGYSNLVQYVDKEFKMSKTQLYVCLKVFRKYCSVKEFEVDSDVLAENTRILEEFVAYSYSQLVEMLAVKDEHLAQFTVDMTIKDMRALKRELYPTEAIEEEEEESSDVGTNIPTNEEYIKSLDSKELAWVLLGGRCAPKLNDDIPSACAKTMKGCQNCVERWLKKPHKDWIK